MPLMLALLAAASANAAPKTRLEFCLELAASRPQVALDDASKWRDVAKGSAQAEALMCLGAAQSGLEQWALAEQSFTAAIAAAGELEPGLRAKLGSMAGDAALAGGAADRALVLLEVAAKEAGATGDLRLTGEVAIDRARALVALKRNDEAAAALVEARTSTADNPLAWLLSATLSRRMGKLGPAQAQIAIAASLAPRDPEVGLEAGVIAMLQGNEAAARRSWESVIAIAPAGESAATAKGYLAQLEPAAQTVP